MPTYHKDFCLSHFNILSFLLWFPFSFSISFDLVDLLVPLLSEHSIAVLRIAEPCSKANRTQNNHRAVYCKKFFLVFEKTKKRRRKLGLRFCFLLLTLKLTAAKTKKASRQSRSCALGFAANQQTAPESADHKPASCNSGRQHTTMDPAQLRMVEQLSQQLYQPRSSQVLPWLSQQFLFLCVVRVCGILPDLLVCTLCFFFFVENCWQT